MAGARDAVIVGGGHNGLVAAAYLARSGLGTLVCERRDVIGGAAVSEHPFGPEYTVTSLSYVVSLLSPSLVRDLGLASFGYHVYPQGPYFAPRADGRALRLPYDPAARRAEIARFLRLLDPAVLPPDFLDDIRAWQSRSGTVKINLALDRLPVFTSHPELDPQVHGGTIVLAESLDDIENAFQEAVSGRPSALPFADICIPSVFDDSLAPAGHHIMSMFTQWVPHGYADRPDANALAAYADRMIARMETVAPGFTDSVLHRQVIGPHQMQQEYGLIGGNIFHGELSLGQMFHARPAAGYADFRTPVRGLYQAGSATHGGGVTGIPGRNAVRQILADRRVARWRQRATPRLTTTAQAPPRS